MKLPLDVFFIEVEGARRYKVDRRKERFSDFASAIGAAFTKGGAEKYLKSLDESLE